MLRSSLILGKEALEKADEKDRKEGGGGGGAGCWGRQGGGGGLESERAHAPTNCGQHPAEDRRVGKVKVRRMRRRGPAAPDSAGPSAGAAWPLGPRAASGVAPGLPPSPAHCSSAGRRGNCLLIAEVRGRGSGRGGAGQHGSVGRAVLRLPRRLSRPQPARAAAAAGAAGAPAPASPEGSALRPPARRARNKWLALALG